MANYRYLVANVLTNTVLAELPLESASFSHVLNGPGSFSGTLALKQPASVETVLKPLLNPQSSSFGKLSLYVERDGVIVWGGMLWGGVPDIDAGTYELSGEGWHSYFRRRVLRAKKVYAAADQTTGIAKNLIDYAQGVTGGNIGIVTSDVAATGVLRDRTYEAFERHNIGQRIEELAAVDNGFDFRYESRWNAGALQTRFLTSYPNTGRQTSFVFEGQLTALKILVDATSMATNVDAIGAGEGDLGLIASISDPALLTTYPMLDDVVSFSDVNVLATLTAQAKRRLTRGKAPIVLPTIEVDPNAEPKLGSYVPGDVVRVRGGVGLVSLDGQYRISEYAVSVDDSGGEKGTMTFANLEVF